MSQMLELIGFAVLPTDNNSHLRPLQRVFLPELIFHGLLLTD